MKIDSATQSITFGSVFGIIRRDFDMHTKQCADFPPNGYRCHVAKSLSGGELDL